ncbi:DUF1499 domain-containing protein [Euhalothece natronophila Z-M001]|uniref:DUF1499 domain-containing protein n=1 Tax=Euhalothece natronophila Z-M001 TaxID=522448 RepID=A0A5B8NMY2_9CHRO|nr:DUF1499 domain-containing protein [Euhalothece natronophila]QDZ39479.1 DUF1499 domain-containing protein [Euhalothece natronophila Z-M001]
MFAGKRPTNLGVKAGKLAPCPETPNCVSSQSEDPKHKIAPLPYVEIDDIKKIVNNMERTSIVEQNENYLYVEFKSKLMGFVDDVEFHKDDVNQVVNVRSASRLGKSDLGVNRKRVETIREALEAINK